MKAALHVPVAVLALSWAGHAHATPPDVEDLHLEVMCAGDAGTAWTTRLHSNGGSHFLVIHRWGLVWLSPSAQSATFAAVGGLVENHVNVGVDEGVDKPGLTWTTSTIDQATWLREHGAETCAPRDLFTHYVEDATGFSVRPTPSGAVRLGLGEQSKMLSGTVVDLRNRASDYGDPTGTLSFDALAPFAFDDEALGWASGPAVATGAHVVARARVEREFDPTDLLVVMDADAFASTTAWLANADGLEHHRAERFELAAQWFREAVDRDLAFSIAAFNLACAHARLGSAMGTARALERLVGVPGMAAKVKADADFDGVRAHPTVQAAVAGLE